MALNEPSNRPIHFLSTAWYRRHFSGDSVNYWTLATSLILVQFAFTLHSQTQLRYEEGAESIRNVYWLELGKIYDGLCSNVGYYGLLAGTYRIFGFSVFTAKTVRAVLAILTILSLAWLARKIVGGLCGLVVLAAASLSPTMLYLNTIQTSYGMDLQYLPICLALLMIDPFDSQPLAFGLSFLVGLICMVAAMSFPTFVLAMPMVGVCAIALFYKKWAGQRIPWKCGGLHLLVFLIGLAAPFVFALCWLDEPGMLLYDPAMDGHGIFRGGGAFSFDGKQFFEALHAVLRDLFVRGSSYHFELSIPEFGSPIGWCACGAAAAAFVMLAWRSAQWWVFVALGALLAVGLLLPSASSGPPGLRRCTTALIAFYSLYAFAWKTLAHQPPASSKVFWLTVILLLILPAHHLWILNWNWKSLTERSPWINQRMIWFHAQGNPQQSLDFLLDFTNKGGPLRLVDDKGHFRQTNYAEIYAALCGYRRWNHLPQVPIRGFDEKSGAFIELDPKLWDTHYLWH